MRSYFKNRLALFTLRTHHELASVRPCSSFHYSACYISETVEWGLMKFGIGGILCKLLGELHFGLCRSNKLRTLRGSYSELFQLTKKTAYSESNSRTWYTEQTSLISWTCIWNTYMCRISYLPIPRKLVFVHTTRLNIIINHPVFAAIRRLGRGLCKLNNTLFKCA
jgi:hypothetical protein